MQNEPNRQPPLSQVLEDLPEAGPVTLGQFARLSGTRAHGLTLLILSLPEIVMYIPGSSAVLAVPIFLVALNLAIHGESGHMPGWLARRTLPARLVRVMRRGLPRFLRWGERLSRPRWPLVAARGRVAGLVCLVHAVVLMAPLPFLNTPPALCVALMAWGLVYRDGIAMVLGAAGSVLVLVAVVTLGAQSWALVTGLWS